MMLLPMVGWLVLAAVPVEPRVVVLEFTGPESVRAECGWVTESTLVELGRVYGRTILSEAELGLLVEHAEDRHEVGLCASEACAAEVARWARADLAMTGAIIPLGPEWLLSLTALDARTALPKASRSITAPSLQALAAAAGPLAVGILASLRDPQSVVSSSVSVDRAKVAVLDLSATGASPELATTLTQILLLEVRKLGELSVISRDEIRALIDYEAERQIASCETDEACLAEIGGALGVDYLISGGVGRFGDEWVVHLKLMAPQRAEVVARAAERFRGPESELVPALRMALRTLLGRPRPAGVLSLAGDEAVEVRIDGGPVQTLPLEQPLSAGRHSLFLAAGGHEDLRRDLYVEPGETTRLVPELAPFPWWSRWTTWAAVGAVVVVGAGVTAALLDRGPDRGSLELDVVVR